MWKGLLYGMLLSTVFLSACRASTSEEPVTPASPPATAPLARAPAEPTPAPTRLPPTPPAAEPDLSPTAEGMTEFYPAPPSPPAAALQQAYPAAASTPTATVDPLLPRPLPYQPSGDASPQDCDELSGVAYHPGRATLFVVDDRGFVCELNLRDGEIVKRERVVREDLEGITVNPESGRLYVAVEGDEAVLEVDPETLEATRRFDLARDFDGRTVLDKDGQGIEGIAFVPDAAHPQGGSFFLTNQSADNDDPEDQSAVFAVVLPLRETTEDEVDDIPIVGYLPQAITDLAGISYDAARDRLLVLSDGEERLVEMTRAGEITAVYALPGTDQEGVAFGPDGTLYIAQDSGGLIRYAPAE